jgi:comEA protein
MTVLGFTRKEQNVIFFLSACVIAGFALQRFQKYWMPLPHTQSENLGAVHFASGHSADSASVSLIAINRADKNLLEQLPGVGPVLAKRILDFREKNGKFKTAEDLMKVKGIGNKTYDRISPFIRCD